MTPELILDPPAQLKVPLAGLTISAAAVFWSIVTVIASTFGARYISVVVSRLSKHIALKEDLADQAARLVRYLVYGLGAAVVLGLLGAPIQPLLAIGLLVVAGLYLVIRGVADNFSAGLVLQARRPIHIGDLIESGDFRGTVTDLNARVVVIETREGRTVHLPNSTVMDEPLINYSTMGRFRSEIQFRLHSKETPDRSDSGLPAADSVATKIISTVTGLDGVIADPEPTALLVGTEPQQLTFSVRYWHLPAEASQVSSQVTATLAREFADTGAVTVSWPPIPPAVAVPGTMPTGQID